MRCCGFAQATTIRASGNKKHVAAQPLRLKPLRVAICRLRKAVSKPIPMNSSIESSLVSSIDCPKFDDRRGGHALPSLGNGQPKSINEGLSVRRLSSRGSCLSVPWRRGRLSAETCGGCGLRKVCRRIGLRSQHRPGLCRAGRARVGERDNCDAGGDGPSVGGAGDAPARRAGQQG